MEFKNSLALVIVSLLVGCLFLPANFFGGFFFILFVVFLLGLLYASFNTTGDIWEFVQNLILSE